MRCALFLLAACATTATPPPTIAGRGAAPVAVAVRATRLIDHDVRNMLELPALAERRGIDRIEERTCRAHFTYVQRVLAGEIAIDWAQRTQVIQRLVTAAEVGGDCRVDADELLATALPRHIGGCTGAEPEEAITAWRRIARVASTPARRTVALRNVAAASWIAGAYAGSVDAWIAAGDAYAAAAASAPDDLALSSRAVDAYENALRIPTVRRLPIARTQVDRIAARLANILDGDAADRARALRASLSR